jgi:hypothetical protein
MINDDRKPWDARLVERMQRGSSTAKDARMAPRARAYYALIYVTLAIVWGGLFFYLVGALMVVTTLGLWQAERRRPR